ncbi:MAG TPA: hypothetical protein VIV60_05500 [Polyangiaceae bacterium]
MSKATSKPRFLVCEDGREYIERFDRYLGDSFDFTACRDFDTLLVELDRSHDASGILLDLDFRRANPAGLVDELGRPIGPVGKERILRYASNQGLCIVSGLRHRGHRQIVMLFADIDAAQQREFLTREFAPLELVPSYVGLSELKRRLDELGAKGTLA